MISTWETCAAIVLFLITPKSVMQAIGKYVPGTQDHTRSQHEYAKRVRDLTADRVTQFSRCSGTRKASDKRPGLYSLRANKRRR